MPQPIRYLIGIDTETGGLDDDAPITQIGAAAYQIHPDWTLTLDDTFNADIRVDSHAKLEAGALRLTGHDPSADGISESEALCGLAAFLAPYRGHALPVAHFAAFDSAILRSAVNRSGLPILHRLHRTIRCSRQAYRAWLDAQHRYGDSAGLKQLAIEAQIWNEQTEEVLHHAAITDSHATAQGYAWLMRRQANPQWARDLLTQAQDEINQLSDECRALRQQLADLRREVSDTLATAARPHSQEIPPAPIRPGDLLYVDNSDQITLHRPHRSLGENTPTGG